MPDQLSTHYATDPAQVSDGGAKLYTVKWSESTAGIKECSARPGSAVIGCHAVEIHKEALGADKIRLEDFGRQEFSMPKKFGNLTPGEEEKREVHVQF